MWYIIQHMVYDDVVIYNAEKGIFPYE